MRDKTQAFDYKVKRFSGLCYAVKYPRTIVKNDTVQGEIISKSFKTVKGAKKWLRDYKEYVRKL